MRLGSDVLEADLYGELGVLPDATESELRVAYRRQVRTSHPDLHPGSTEAVQRTKRLNVAARVLLDPALRRSYDRGRQRAAGSRAPSGSERSSTHPPRAPRPWFERGELSFENEWVPPPAPEQPLPSSRFAEFFRELRGRDGHLSLRIQGAIESLSSRQQLGLAAALCCLALLLIFWARPQGLIGDSMQPTSVDPHAISP